MSDEFPAYSLAIQVFIWLSTAYCVGRIRNYFTAVHRKEEVLVEIFNKTETYLAAVDAEQESIVRQINDIRRRLDREDAMRN